MTDHAPVGTLDDASDETTQEAGIRLLTRAAAAIPADHRRPIVARYLASGVTEALAWLAAPEHRRGRISAASRVVTASTRTPGWETAELEALSADIQFVHREHPSWPSRLNDLGDYAPIGLWVRGTIPDLTGGALSIVGSRKLSSTGHSRIDRVVKALAIPVISGLAVGADEAAHRSALLYGVPTVTVLPSGVDAVYPSQNRHLAGRIVGDGGAVLSEVPPNQSPSRFRFLDRNRIIAALGTASLIVEASAISGTMNEARHAHALRRNVGAVPGTPGADQLIADGIAMPIHSLTDIETLIETDAFDT